MDRSEKKPGDLRILELTPRELSLLLKYVYPFPDEKEILRESRAIQGFHHVPIGAYWIELTIGDLLISAKQVRTTRCSMSLMPCAPC